MTRLAAGLRDERGEGLITGLVLIAGVLIPLMFIVPLFGRTETAHLAAQQAAQEAVRAATLAADAPQAQLAAANAVAAARVQTGVPIEGDLAGDFSRGSVLTETVRVSVPLGTIPGLGAFGTLAVHGQASAPIDEYRSLPATGTQTP